MGQFFQVNGDYNIKTRDGGTLTLDTGPGVGTVTVTGDLYVAGNTVTVEAEDLNVEDNIITLNYGETGAGVTLRYSGIEIERGSLPNTRLFWDEADDTWNITIADGYTNSQLRLQKILTDPVVDGGDLTLIGSGTGVVKVLGTSNYEDQVTHDDDVPNKKYVDDAIQLNPTFQIVRDDTRVVSFDANDPLDLAFFPIGPFVSQPAVSQVAIVVNDSIKAQFFANEVLIEGLTIFRELANPDDPNPIIGIPRDNAVVIQTRDSSANIKLETNGTGKIEVTYGLQLDLVTTSDPSAVDDTVILWHKAAGGGNTGLYHSTKVDSDDVQEELINKKRALLFSMIF